MKFFLSILLIACFSTTLLAQTIVPTTPSNRNFILEEYTGTNCSWCPDGHRIAQTIMANNPGRAWVINVHQGGYSGNSPDYKTDWANELAAQYSISSYPNGTCNRGNSTVNRGAWNSQCTNILSQPSVVNIAAQGTVDWETRHLTLLVEVYYTGNATQHTNKLNVALLQSSVFGPQSGKALFPEMVFGTQYKHMHMLRDLITGQWGVDVELTTTGSFSSYTFEYDIPTHVRNVPIELDDIEILAFVAENQKTIITGTEAELTFLNLPASNIKYVELGETKIYNCVDNACAYTRIKNAGSTPITSVEFAYTIAGGASHTLIWDNRTIHPIKSDTIQIPLDIIPNQNQNIKVDLIKINNENVATISKNVNVKKEITEGDSEMTFVLTTDRYASETTFKIFNPNGTVLLSGGPWSDLSGNGTTVREFNFTPIMDGCHRVEVYDAYGDGINSGAGAGNVKILNSAGTQIYYNNGQFGSKLVTMVCVSTTPYTITASSGENGTISPEGDKVYTGCNIIAKYEFTPVLGYVVEEVYIDDEPMNMPNATSYTFTALDNDHTIHVTFKEGTDVYYTIAASAGENGTIYPNGEKKYMENEDVEFTFTPDEGYEVAEVYIDDDPMNMAQATGYTFTALDKNYTIHITFRLIQGIKDVDGVKITIAPNPVNDRLLVTGIYDKLEILSISGQILTTVYNQPSVDVAHLAKGIYFVRIQANDQMCTFKVIK